MQTSFVFVAVGAIVWLFGVTMIAWHVRKHRQWQSDCSLPPHEQNFLEHQYRRRMQTSALTITLGALISLCDYLPQFRSSPGFAAGYVITLLLLCMWLILLALGDALASRMHVKQSLRRNRNSRQMLQQAVDDLRREQHDAMDRALDPLVPSGSPRE